MAAAFVMLLATAAQAVIITVTANPDTLPSGGGTVEYTVSVTCEESDEGYCFVTSIEDDTHGPITPEDCPDEPGSVFRPFYAPETRSCTFTREVIAEGPTTVTNTTTVHGLVPQFDPESGSTVAFEEEVETTVTVLAPVEEDEGSGGGGRGSFASCDVDGVPTNAELESCVDRHVNEEFARRGVPGHSASTVAVNTGGGSESVQTSVEETEITESDVPDVEDIELEVADLL